MRVDEYFLNLAMRFYQSLERSYKENEPPLSFLTWRGKKTVFRLKDESRVQICALGDNISMTFVHLNTDP